MCRTHPLNSYMRPTSCLLTPVASLTHFPEYVNLGTIFVHLGRVRPLLDKLGHEPNLRIEAMLTVSRISVSSSLCKPHCKANFNSNRS